jgi:hypothetical protein
MRRKAEKKKLNRPVQPLTSLSGLEVEVDGEFASPMSDLMTPPAVRSQVRYHYNPYRS